jgi:hypothetical protein
VPPAQGEAWTPAAQGLPEVLVTAIVSLFRQGLADPRGLEYRAVEIATGDVWSGGGRATATHAWVLPQGDGGARFGVAWNGLVYPLATVGPAADLRADVAALVKKDAETRAAWAREHPDSEFYRFRHAWPEGASVSHETLLPLKVALLLRAGEGKLAGEVWAAWTAGMRANTNDDGRHLADPYLMLATDWVWALFDRAVCAHMRGDDAIALASARGLASVGPAVEEGADRRGFERRGRSDAERRHLSFLEPLPALLADQERRATRAPAGKEAGIAALIESLDQVDARQWGQPGGVSLAEDRRVQALIKEGEAAVEPLLRVLEGDTRLTRSVHFWRDFAHHRSILGVHEAAYVALSGILDASFFGAASTGDDLTARGAEGRRRVAAQIREHWTKWRGVPLVERWYRILADDSSPGDPWLQAARSISLPANVSVLPGSMAFTTTQTTPAGGTPALRGEALRSKTGPSVTELMERRVNDLAAKDGADANAPLGGSCAMAKLLGDWDAPAARPALARQVDRARRLFASRRGDRALGTSSLSRCIAELTTARVRGGDGKALDEYAQWIRTTAPEDIDWYVKEVFEPMWRNHRHPAIAGAGQALFGAARSPFRQLIGPGRLEDLLEVPMVRVAGFQELVVKALGDRRSIGRGEVASADNFRYELDSGGSGSMGIDKNDPFTPPVGTRHPVRACDFYARSLARLDGAPAFQLHWSEQRRNEALNAMRSFVQAQPAR